APAKTPVSDLNKLTEDEKAKVADAVKASNPTFPNNTDVTVDDKGNVTITYPDQSTDTIPADQTVEKKAPITDGFTPKDPVKTVVSDKTKLTSDEKAKVVDEIKKANPDFPEGTTVTVADNGEAKITYPDQSTDTIPADRTVVGKPITDEINPEAPAKTPVSDLNKLTEEEKAKVADAVKASNPTFPNNTDVTVDDKGNVTITYPDQSTDTIPADQTVEKKAPITDGFTPKDPVKTVVSDKTNLTSDEKAKVVDEIKKANPDFPEGTTVTVADNGEAKITYPDQSTDTIPADRTVVGKPITDEINPKAPAKTPVSDLNKLTEDEKAKVADAVKTSNPTFPNNTDVTVDDKGNVTITYPDQSTDTIPADQTVEKKAPITDGFTPKDPVKTVVSDKTKLTEEEKGKVSEAVKKANPDFPEGTTVEVGNDGTVTVTYPDKS
ncbi:LEA family epithelial adhesin, partial [Streptococcus ovuberis]